MDKNQRWQHFIDVMERQLGLLDEFALSLDELRASLYSRDWAALERAFSLMEEMGASMEAMEDERLRISRELCGNEGPGGSESSGEPDVSSLESCVARLPREVRGRFLEVRGRLRARIISVRSRIKGVAEYAASRFRLSQDLMKELVPSSRGCTYNKQGISRQTDRNPLILSRHL